MRKWYHVPVDAMTGLSIRFSQLYRCDRCKYGQLSPMPTAAEVPALYRLERYYTHGEGHMEESLPTNLIDRLRVHFAWRMDRGHTLTAEWIVKVLPEGARTICDIGCGDAWLAGRLADAGYEVTGLEIDPDALSRELHSKIDFVSASAEDCLDVMGTRRFDVVVMSHVLEHCIDPLRAVANARKLLKKGGIFICEVPNNLALALRYSGAAWLMLDVPRHLHFFSTRSLLNLFAQAQLKVIGTYFSGYSREFSNAWIETEQKLHERIAAKVADHRPVANSRWRAWKLLGSTAFAPRQLKYDSVRLVAMAD